MKHLVEIDHEALRIGAVNTIIKSKCGLKGYNTDGIGALRALQEYYGDLRDAKIVVIGAGGASKAICYKLSVNASKVIILNRTPMQKLYLITCHPFQNVKQSYRQEV